MSASYSLMRSTLTSFLQIPKYKLLVNFHTKKKKNTHVHTQQLTNLINAYKKNTNLIKYK